MTLNLTDAQRESVNITYSVNKFIATFGEHNALLGAYYTKAAMNAELDENGVDGQMDAIAQSMFLGLD